MTAVTKDEWNAIDDGVRPGIRFCSPVMYIGEQPPVRTGVVENCSWCNRLIWVDEAQEMPAEAREQGIIPICAYCALEDEDIRKAVVANIQDAYETWRETGIIKAFPIEPANG
jgi:hypothetical protein